MREAAEQFALVDLGMEGRTADERHRVEGRVAPRKRPDEPAPAVGVEHAVPGFPARDRHGGDATAPREGPDRPPSPSAQENKHVAEIVHAGGTIAGVPDA